MDSIIITDASEHNLKNISLSIPRNTFTVITGLSGSGKSSLAFDTLYAEGQRRYVESLSPYARQFLEKMKKPDVGRIQGLSPSISIEQKHTSRNPRSTVGTVTEIYDYLRLLFAKVGNVRCYSCGRPVTAISIDDIMQQLEIFDDGTRLHILAPVVRERKGEFKDVLERIRKQGFSKVRIDGQVYDLADRIRLSKSKRHTIDIVIDRTVYERRTRTPVRVSIETALKYGNGACRIEVLPATGKTKRTKKAQQFIFSEKLYCMECGIGFEELSPNTFSFNSSQGACPTCKGIGMVTRLVKDFVIADESKPLLRGAINKEINFSFNKYYIHELIDGLKNYYHFDITAPFRELPSDVQEAFFWGNTELSGILDILRDLLHRTDSVSIKSKLRRFLHEEQCPVCRGGRLRQESLGVLVQNENIVTVSALSLTKLQAFINSFSFSPQETVLAEPIVKEIRLRLRCLCDMGLGYLSLDRSAATLSGGELQRVRLAAQIGTGLTGVLYVLDEPSIGLHPKDNHKLLALFQELKKLNNTVVVVEHDEETMRRSDFIVDLGPGAGDAGGKVLFATHTKRINEYSRKQKKDTLPRAFADSLTVQFLSKKRVISVPAVRKKMDQSRLIAITGAAEHNLKEIDVAFPLGLFLCVTGVSGSGKSTLVHDILYKALHNKVWDTDYEVGKHTAIDGLSQVRQVIEIDQNPIGRTPRSNPVTYVEIFSYIRNLFSNLSDAKIRGYKPGHFSFNVKGGRCEACEGAGMQRIEMSFLPDVHVLCDVCRGNRYKSEILEVRYKGKSIADVLDMQVSDACTFFGNVPLIREKLTVLNDVGLGYIKLGQPSTTLSGGEAQRIKIAYELSKRTKGHTVYLLDEPTTGLHFADIDNLLRALLQLRDNGNTVMVIEHNLDVVKMADYLIDLGPEGGDAGGYVVAAGTPEEIIKNKRSYTGRYLAPYLK